MAIVPDPTVSAASPLAVADNQGVAVGVAFGGVGLRVRCALVLQGRQRGTFRRGLNDASGDGALGQGTIRSA
jgi:hypothetical protein